MNEVPGDTIRRMMSEIKAIDSAIGRQHMDQRGASGTKQRNEEDKLLHEVKAPLIYYLLSQRMKRIEGLEDTFQVKWEQGNHRWLRIIVPSSSGHEIYTQINLDEVESRDKPFYDQIVTLLGDDPLDGEYEYVHPVDKADEAIE